jgi:hypothetical protein
MRPRITRVSTLFTNVFAVPRQRLTEWAAPAAVMPADAFEREIEPSAIFLLNPRAPLMVSLSSIRFPGKTMVKPRFSSKGVAAGPVQRCSYSLRSTSTGFTASARRRGR